MSRETDRLIPRIGTLLKAHSVTRPYVEAEQQHHLPPGLLGAIARAESGKPVVALNDVRAWPWTINADGRGLYLESKAAAIAWVNLQESRHHYIDIGCLQVDVSLHPKAFASVEDAFDPILNADFAAGYLMDLYHGAAKGNWNMAVGLYHSHTPMLAAEYRDRVAQIGARVLRGVLDPVPLYVWPSAKGLCGCRWAREDRPRSMLNGNRRCTVTGPLPVRCRGSWAGISTDIPARANS